MPLLRFLDVELSNGHFFEFHQVPLLRTVCLTGTAASYVTLPWSQLTCLTLRYAYRRECTPVLQKTTNLVHCKLYLSATVHDEPEPDIVLPSLESLTFYHNGDTPVTGYLTTFIVPALCSLEVPEQFLEPNPIRSLKSFISKSGCSLQEVHITGRRTVSEDSFRLSFPMILKFSFAERL
jgi:hypothetical protein